MITRRSFLGGLLAAPAIIKVATLMPVKAWIEPARMSIFTGEVCQWEGMLILDGDAIALWSRKLAEEMQRTTYLPKYLDAGRWLS